MPARRRKPPLVWRRREANRCGQIVLVHTIKLEGSRAKSGWCVCEYTCSQSQLGAKFWPMIEIVQTMFTRSSRNARLPAGSVQDSVASLSLRSEPDWTGEIIDVSVSITHTLPKVWVNQTESNPKALAATCQSTVSELMVGAQSKTTTRTRLNYSKAQVSLSPSLWLGLLVQVNFFHHGQWFSSLIHQTCIRQLLGVGCNYYEWVTKLRAIVSLHKSRRDLFGSVNWNATLFPSILLGCTMKEGTITCTLYPSTSCLIVIVVSVPISNWVQRRALCTATNAIRRRRKQRGGTNGRADDPFPFTIWYPSSRLLSPRKSF